MAIKSLGNPIASYDNYEASTGIINTTPALPSLECIFDWDPGRLTGYSDNQVISNSVNLAQGLSYADTAAQGLSSGLSISVNGGSFRWKSANGGHLIADGSNQGRITVGGDGSPTSMGGNGGLLDNPSLTIEGWFQYDGSGRDVLVSRYGGSYPNQFNHIVDPGGQFHMNSSGVNCGAGNFDWDSFGNNVWFHCVWMYDHTTAGNGTHRWYVNNQLKGTYSSGTSLETDNSLGFSIASRSDDFERLEGRIGQVRLYNTALTSGQIGSRFNATKARYGF